MIRREVWIVVLANCGVCALAVAAHLLR